MRQRVHTSALALGIGMVWVIAPSSPAFAACTNQTPASGETVTCTGVNSGAGAGVNIGSSSSDITVNVESGTLGPAFFDAMIRGFDATNFTLDVSSGATVTSDHSLGTVYVYGSSSGTVIVDGLIRNIDAGSAVHLRGAAGWSVSIGETGEVRNGSSTVATIDVGSGADSVTVAGAVNNFGGGNAIFFSGGDDRLELWSTYAITGAVDGGIGTDTLALGGSDDGTFDVSSIGSAAQFRRFEVFEKTGTSTWTLTGTSTATGDWTVRAGTLDIDPAADLSTMGVIVENGGRITGRGAVGFMAVANGGVLAPTGHSTDNMIVSDLVFNPGSTLVVTDSSRISTNSTTINGGWVQHTGTAFVGSNYIISGSSITGQFDGVSTSFAFLDAALRYDYISSMSTYFVFLELTLKPTEEDGPAFKSFANTKNQFAIANTLGGFSAGNAIYDAIIGLTDDEDVVRASYDSLTGEIGASSKAAATNTALQTTDIVSSRLQSAFTGVSSPSMMTQAFAASQNDKMAALGFDAFEGSSPAPLAYDAPAVWTQAFGSWNEIDGDANVAKVDSDTAGYLIGADAFIGGVRFGAYAGQSRTNSDVSARSSSGESDNTHAGAYAGGMLGNLRLSSALGYTWYDMSTDRRVVVGGFTDRLRASYDAGAFQAFGEAAYHAQFAGAAIEPFANISYVRLHTDAHTEQGGVAALTTASSTDDTPFTTLGLRLSRSFAYGGMTGSLRGSAAWRRAFGDIVPEVVQRFASGGSSFTIAGAPIAEDVAVLQAGGDIDLTAATLLSFGYEGQLGSDATGHTVNGTLRWAF